MNYFKLWIGDYQRDTAHLSVTEHGAFMLMLQHYYATEKPLPKGAALYRLLRATSKAEREAADAIAAQFWTETEAGLVNERADEEIAKSKRQASANRATAQAREASRKDARTEHESCTSRSTKQEPTHSHSHSHSQETDPNPDPDPPLKAATGRSGSEQPRAGAQEPRQARRKRTPETGLPEGFGISERVRQWAAEHGHTRLDEHLESFRIKAEAKGYRYADWDAALMNAIRDNWARLGEPQRVVPLRQESTYEHNVRVAEEWLKNG